jgi:hypothetical protein
MFGPGCDSLHRKYGTSHRDAGGLTCNVVTYQSKRSWMGRYSESYITYVICATVSIGLSTHSRSCRAKQPLKEVVNYPVRSNARYSVETLKPIRYIGSTWSYVQRSLGTTTCRVRWVKLTAKGRRSRAPVVVVGFISCPIRRCFSTSIKRSRESDVSLRMLKDRKPAGCLAMMRLRLAFEAHFDARRIALTSIFRAPGFEAR